MRGKALVDQWVNGKGRTGGAKRGTGLYRNSKLAFRMRDPTALWNRWVGGDAQELMFWKEDGLA
jgi:hypothetical protein